MVPPFMVILSPLHKVVMSEYIMYSRTCPYTSLHVPVLSRTCSLVPRNICDILSITANNYVIIASSMKVH